MSRARASGIFPGRRYRLGGSGNGTAAPGLGTGCVMRSRYWTAADPPRDSLLQQRDDLRTEPVELAHRLGVGQARPVRFVDEVAHADLLGQLVQFGRALLRSAEDEPLVDVGAQLLTRLLHRRVLTSQAPLAVCLVAGSVTHERGLDRLLAGVGDEQLAPHRELRGL